MGIFQRIFRGGDASGGGRGLRGFGTAHPSSPLLRTSPMIQNAMTGMGTQGLDKSANTQFTVRNISWQECDALYRNSWATAKMIDIPVDDIWIRGRQFVGDDENLTETMVDASESLCLTENIQMAMKTGRLYGTGLLIISQRDVPLSEPLEIDRIRPGSVAGFIVTDRWHANIREWVVDMQMENYGQPYMYEISPRLSHDNRNVDVHHSRIIRFDGIAPTLTEGWITVSGRVPEERDWGRSIVQRAYDEVMHDAELRQSVGHLVQESSIFAIRMEGFKNMVRGKPDPEDPDLNELAASVNAMKSIYRTLFVDREDEVERINVNLAGAADLMNQMADRLAAIADIPKTRFLGSSPGGLNATGDGDWKNYSAMIAAMQVKQLTKPLKLLDMVVARHAGLPEPPEYKWLPLVDLSDEESANAEKAKAEVVLMAFKEGVITENEARERLSNLETFGELGDMPESEFERLAVLAGRYTEPEPPGPADGG